MIIKSILRLKNIIILKNYLKHIKIKMERILVLDIIKKNVAVLNKTADIKHFRQA